MDDFPERYGYRELPLQTPVRLSTNFSSRLKLILVRVRAHQIFEFEHNIEILTEIRYRRDIEFEK